MLGYRIFRNEGENGPLDVEVTSMASNDPNLNSHIIDFSATGVVGRVYKFKVRAENINGDYVETNALSVALASLPDKPTTPPSSDPTVTNMQTLGIIIDLFDPTNNGGSEILVYEI